MPALTKIVENWLNALNNSETVGTVFLDLTNAFDLTITNYFSKN